MSTQEQLSGWGGWPRRVCNTAPLRADEPVLDPGSAITRGKGRSYGDVAINPGRTLKGASRKRMLEFDADTGELVAEAGVTLAEIIDVFLPRGWFPAVTPGTKFVTIGGAIACDVHGKNHHKVGSFGDHVNWIDLLCADGQIRRCSSQKNKALYNATIGGVGLTGHMLRASIRLMPVQSAWIAQETIPTTDLDHAIDLFEANLDATYSVAWIDCQAKGAARGRSIVLLGEHAKADDLSHNLRAKPFHYPAPRPKSMPVHAPAWVLNSRSIQAFNHLYYRGGLKNEGHQIVDYDRYFYPLDSILHWNRLYGRRGFAQYQCALPLAQSRVGLAQLLDKIAESGLGSFLAVLKRFGAGAPERPLSFPIEGYTLALDFAMTPEALTLMDELDEITTAHGGRVYLAKDSRLRQNHFEAGYGDGLAAFRKLRRDTGADQAFTSLLSDRLSL